MSKAILVQGLAYGDEGKGATVDFLCRQLLVNLVVRFNGGSQAAHNVVTPEGVHHTFSQFGSGMLANNKVRTHLSRFMLVDPLTMMNEAEALTSKRVHGVWNRTTVDPRCVVVTPFHKRVNRLREESRGDARHGSCGMGIGVAREWWLRHGGGVLLAGDLSDFDLTRHKLRLLESLALQEFSGALIGAVDRLDLAIDYYNWVKYVHFYAALPPSELTVFEGAQGVLLDETHGEAPYNTWTDCTFANADALLDEAGVAAEDRLRVGCLRTYLTRHGAGPLPGELDCAFDGPSEAHNGTNKWQGHFRKAPIDFGVIERALSIAGGVDCLALSHLDCLPDDAAYFILALESALRTPVGIAAYGPTATHRELTPSWKDAWRAKAEKAGEAACL